MWHSEWKITPWWQHWRGRPPLRRLNVMGGFASTFSEWQYAHFSDAVIGNREPS